MEYSTNTSSLPFKCNNTQWQITGPIESSAHMHKIIKVENSKIANKIPMKTIIFNTKIAYLRVLRFPKVP